MVMRVKLLQNQQARAIHSKSLVKYKQKKSLNIIRRYQNKGNMYLLYEQRWIFHMFHYLIVQNFDLHKHFVAKDSL